MEEIAMTCRWSMSHLSYLGAEGNVMLTRREIAGGFKPFADSPRNPPPSISLPHITNFNCEE